MMRLSLLLTLTLGLLSCTSMQTSNSKLIRIAQDVYLKLPEVSKISPALEAEQLLTIEKDGQRHSLQIVVRNDGKKILVTGLIPMGPRFTVTYDGAEIRDDSPQFGTKRVDMTYALADMAIVVASNEILKKSILPMATVIDRAGTRDIVVNGRPLIEIRYSEKAPWKGVITYSHLERSYRLEIKTLRMQYL